MKRLYKTSLCAAALLALTATAAQADSASELVIENFVGTINWSNAEREIRITKQENEKGLRTYSDDRFIIDGGIDRLDGDKCKGYYGSYDISLFGRKKKNEGNFGGYEDLEDYPVLDLTLPEGTVLTVRNSIVFTNGTPNIASADLSLKHCGKINLGDVAGDVAVEGRGSADLSLGNANEVKSEMSGSGDIEADTVTFIRAEGRGSGDIQITETENADIEISGSGDVEIDTITGSAIIQSSGSGDVDFDTVRGSLDYQGSGSGDLSVDDIGGNGANRVALQSAGSGDVSIGDGTISELYVRVSGASDANIDAIVKDASVKASGSSDVYIDTVTGSLEQRTSGSADVTVSNRD